MSETTEAGAAAAHDHEVEIEVNYRRVRVPRRVTGLAIKQAAHVDESFDLYRIEGDDETLVTNEEELEVHEGSKFVATPGLEPA
jgi:hypothetical protein